MSVSVASHLKIKYLRKNIDFLEMINFDVDPVIAFKIMESAMVQSIVRMDLTKKKTCVCLDPAMKIVFDVVMELAYRKKPDAVVWLTVLMVPMKTNYCAEQMNILKTF